MFARCKSTVPQLSCLISVNCFSSVQSDLCQQLYDVLRNQKKEDGTLLCDAFIRVPKRRQEPGYYEVVSNPIDLLKVQQKLKTDEYRDMDDLAADIQLMVNNAKAFYMVRSLFVDVISYPFSLYINNNNKYKCKILVLYHYSSVTKIFCFVIIIAYVS